MSKDLEEKMRKLIHFAFEKKAQNLIVFNLQGKSVLTDFLIICSGQGEMHTKAIAKNVILKAKEHGIHLDHNEGLENGQWILLDFIDVIVHIFEQKKREFYKLEELWECIPQLKFVDEESKIEFFSHREP
ncbi:MAG: ribosome silencing factor [Candidatus Cloacimonadota bacterium]|nr:MAG: ribosome silencing factor [Candidatus Cloacimonadota bacterium]